MINDSKYRPHIDGLRAVAVLAVALFHLKLGLPGGFVGVDVFFVISGFLISGIILAEAEAGSFSFARFYARRARRILPALVATVIAVLGAGYLLLFPPEYVRLAHSAVASLLFSGNIYFWRTAGYFGPAATDLPLLHLWSLGVEEQFYLLFPVLVLILLRWAPRAFWPLLALGTVLSFVGAEWALGRNPPAAFYLLPFRGGELGLGALVVLAARRFRPLPIVAEIASVIGAGAIAWSVFALSEASRFPGFAALPVCVGTALIIWGGEARQTFVARVLSIPGLPLIGRWSYSLYLIHWPLYVFARRALPATDPTTLGLGVLAATVALAGLSYLLIETPPRRLLKGTAAALGAGAIALTVSAAAASVVAIDGFPKRFDAAAAKYASFIGYSNPAQFNSRVCFLEEDQNKDNMDLGRCLPKGGKLAVLWGDSGVAQYSQAMHEALGAQGYALGQLTMSACPPLIGWAVAERPHCQAFNDFALAHILAARPDVVIIGAAWPNKDEPYAYLEQSLKPLTDANIKVVLVGLGPIYNATVPVVLGQRLQANDPSTASRVADLVSPQWIAAHNDMLAATAAKHPNVTFVRLYNVICAGDACPLLADGDPIQFDMFHTTPAGAKLFVAKILGAAPSLSGAS